MSLIAIILALVVESFFEQLEKWRDFTWFGHWHDWVSEHFSITRFKDSPLAVVAVFLPVIVLVWLLEYLLDGVWGLFSYLFAVVVLIYSIGPIDIVRHVQGYVRGMRNDDSASAKQHAELILNQPIADSDHDITQQLKKAILVRANDSLFGTLFWFIVIGAQGAILFRMACLLKERYAGVHGGMAESCRDLYRILIWLPARVCVVGFALAGDFLGTFQMWQRAADFFKTDSESLLVESGLGALNSVDASADDAPDIDGVANTMALVKRTVVVFLAILALLTIVKALVYTSPLPLPAK